MKTVSLKKPTDKREMICFILSGGIFLSDALREEDFMFLCTLIKRIHRMYMALKKPIRGNQ